MNDAVQLLMMFLLQYNIVFLPEVLRRFYRLKGCSCLLYNKVFVFVCTALGGCRGKRETAGLGWAVGQCFCILKMATMFGVVVEVPAVTRLRQECSRYK